MLGRMTFAPRHPSRGPSGRIPPALPLPASPTPSAGPASRPTRPGVATAARLPSGWPELDACLGGGWPGGVLCELCGRGRTSLALGAVRQAQARGLPVAWIDGGGAFCPVTARIDLSALTLVRPDGGVHGDGGEGALTAAQRGRLRRRGLRPGVAADRALLAADLLLRSRAFGLVVLDLPETVLRGGGAASRWFRLARQAEAARCWLLLLGSVPRSRAGSAADLVLFSALRPVPVEEWCEPPPPRLAVRLARWRGAPHSVGEDLLLGAREGTDGDGR